MKSRFCLRCKKYNLPSTKMSFFLSETERLKFNHKLSVVNPPLSCIRQQNVDRFASIALALEIPYLLLGRRYSMVKENKDQGNVNYSVERREHEPSKLLNNKVRSVKDEHDELKAIA